MFVYLKKYQELPAQPGIVFSSIGKIVVSFISEVFTILLFTLSQAHSSALPSGGSPSLVGKYFSISGSFKGKQDSSII